MKKRFLAVVLALSAVLSLASCSRDTTPVVMQLGENIVTEAMYKYWACSAKGGYLYTYEDIEDTDEFWKTELTEGVDAKEYFDTLTLESAKSKLVAMMLFDKYRLSFTDKEKSNVSDYVDDLVKEYANGNRSELNALLGEYGVNLDLLEKIYIEEAKLSKVYEYLYGEGGEESATDEELEAYYQDNYVHMQIIFVNNAYQYVLDEDGDVVTDDNGYYQYEALDPEIKEEKDAVIKKVTDGLAAGEDFDKLYNEYSEFKSYSGGFYYSRSRQYSDLVYYQLVNAADKIEVGETTVISGESGTCILKKLPLDEGAWNSEANKDFFPESGDSAYENTVEQAKFYKMLEEYYKDIEIDEKSIEKFSVTEITPCYSF